MIIDLPSGGRARLIGDPHLGLKFETGVPLHRRGEREQKQFAKFVEALRTPDVEFNIMVGDLFEHPYVSHGVVVAAAEAYLAAAKDLPATKFAAMAGNHDRPRAVGQTGAWESFRAMIDGRRDNLVAVDKPGLLDQGLAVVPWEWDRTAIEQVKDLRAHQNGAGVVIGHWDLKSYGGDESHLAPTAALTDKGWSKFYSGHYHTPGEYRVGGHTVHCTGSLEPYSHGEDPCGVLYVTAPLSEVEANPEQFKDKCLRVILNPGEELPSGLDCLAVTPLRQQGEARDVPEIVLDGFDWDKVLKHELSQVNDEEVVTFINDRL